MARTSHVKRSTKETEVEVNLNIDGQGKSEIDSGIPFLDHMLSQLSRHGYFDIKLKAKGDIHIDYHHTVEDIGIVLGEAFAKALGDKKSICRFADTQAPLNEALAQTVIDISGRGYFVFNAALPKSKIGEFDVELVPEFFQAFAMNAGITLHMNCPYWENLHHIVEALFKSFARSLDIACSLDGRNSQVPSTKGKL
ncbi:MAG: imidazoleglycerol-phosphate dehydratase HisB [Nitrospinaceae bacterium]|jgi:imidazoleglycerol-phosphate dehydratase|nr:imidazoleglycerol-phosphate dehydratase HisB [Nitrospina sp.]MBT7271722.1 imidazoleglycerol-phosphate dehydratase HisB [Nitrospina sp.]MDG1844074.1 imidazoleglycerol-phosphate dehydratase HisB [Nitrospinaceae bacterium]|tara:strand:- start:2406 stop:2993 length:588 start_codon:yes stop_codon:yes gene_type:complete